MSDFLYFVILSGASPRAQSKDLVDGYRRALLCYLLDEARRTRRKKVEAASIPSISVH
jgi:hypothetical protein